MKEGRFGGFVAKLPLGGFGHMTSLQFTLFMCIYIYIPESSKGLKFEPLNHQKQTVLGLKFDTLGVSIGTYIYIYYKIPIRCLYHIGMLRGPLDPFVTMASG